MNRILLIEDDAGAQLLYRSRLTDLGYQVVVASTGAMGLMEARSAPFDLYLVDIGLGSGIDGFEVCRRLKTIPEIHGVPVVLISGHVKSQEDLHRGYEAGCQSFLVKGDLMLLEDVVRAMLRIKSLQDDLAMQNRMLEERNRRLEVERVRAADLEHALSNNMGGALRGSGRPDGLLLVDGDGVVRASDRGARDLIGQVLDGKHLALLAPESRLEAVVRNARTEPSDSVRFELPERAGRATRTLHARIFPFMPEADRQQTSLRLVLLFDPARQRVVPAEGSSERGEWAPLIEAARVVFRPSALLGTSAPIRELRAGVARAARTEGPVLVVGPSGSGKELVARILHYSSVRSGPFVAVSCSASKPQELERELFGAARTAEAEELPGVFLGAGGGTLYLRDVERLTPALQERLLEAVAHGRVRHPGALAESCDLRVVAGTRTDLGRAVAQGQFLRELWERLSATRLVLPPLRERTGDIEALCRHFAQVHGRTEGLRLSSAAARLLARYPWNDNVRELELVMQSACAAAQGEEIEVGDLPAALKEEAVVTGVEEPASLAKRRKSGAYLEREFEGLMATLDSTTSLLDSYEKGALLHALRLSQGDKLAAARLLKVGKSTFYRKLKQHGIA